MAKKKEEAPVEGAPAEGAVAAPKKKKKLILILAIAIPLLLGGVAAALFFTGIIGGKKNKDPYEGLPTECIPKSVQEERAASGKEEHSEEKHGKEDDKKSGDHAAEDAKDDHAKDDKKSSHAEADGEHAPELTPAEQKACEKAKKKMAKAEGHGEEKKEEGGGHGEEGKEGGGAASNFFDLPNMVVNLDSSGKRQVFLKLSVSLELDDPHDKAALEAVMPRIVDQFQVYLRELRVEDLRGSAGVYRLRQELLARVQPAVDPIEIKDVLFKEILVQ